MDIAHLSRLIENVLRIGTITEVDHAGAMCRVATGSIITNWLPWFAHRAGETRTWDPPTLGEQVMVFSPSGELAGGIVFTGIYSGVNPAPSNIPDTHVTEYPDGARIAYNHATGALTAIGIQTATVQAAVSITLDTPRTHVTGELEVDGLLTYKSGMQGTGGDGASAVIDGSVSVTGDVVARGISLRDHIHDEHDGGTTGAPK